MARILMKSSIPRSSNIILTNILNRNFNHSKVWESKIPPEFGLNFRHLQLRSMSRGFDNCNDKTGKRSLAQSGSGRPDKGGKQKPVDDSHSDIPDVWFPPPNEACVFVVEKEVKFCVPIQCICIVDTKNAGDCPDDDPGRGPGSGPASGVPGEPKK